MNKNFELVKKNLRVRLFPIKGNEEMLSYPHIKVCDLIIVATIDIGNGKEEIINYHKIIEYGISFNDLFKTGFEIMEKEFPVNIMNLFDIFPIPVKRNQMYVVTSTAFFHGATVLFYPGMMEMLAKVFKGNYFILPSSIHECITIPDNGDFTYEGLKEMVTTINHTQVEPKDRLTDEVYYYDVVKREFRKAR